MVDGWEAVVIIGSDLDLYSFDFAFSRTISGAPPKSNQGHAVKGRWPEHSSQNSGCCTRTDRTMGMMRRGQPIIRVPHSRWTRIDVTRPNSNRRFWAASDSVSHPSHPTWNSTEIHPLQINWLRRLVSPPPRRGDHMDVDGPSNIPNGTF